MLTDPALNMAVGLWLGGCDTLQIAKLLRVKESEVYNSLSKVKSKHKQTGEKIAG